MKHQDFVDQISIAYAIYADEHELSAQQGLDLADDISEATQSYAYDRMEHPDIIYDVDLDMM